MKDILESPVNDLSRSGYVVGARRGGWWGGSKTREEIRLYVYAVFARFVVEQT